ncbi:MAG: hypothetical protein JSV61_09700 [Anaerolineales bacterium]|nr:MAG: hypothetical protein JSV61_09700 [Anaerolineales bacterium]
MLFPALFGIVVGLLMIGEWSAFYFSRQIPELETEPIRIGFHLAGEFATALGLLAGGIGLLAGAGWGSQILSVAIGMLLYTALVSPGYFAQKGQWKWLGVFGVLILFGLASLLVIS